MVVDVKNKSSFFVEIWDDKMIDNMTKRRIRVEEAIEDLILLLSFLQCHLLIGSSYFHPFYYIKTAKFDWVLET